MYTNTYCKFGNTNLEIQIHIVNICICKISVHNAFCTSAIFSLNKKKISEILSIIIYFEKNRQRCC